MFRKLIMATLGSALLVAVPSIAQASDDYAGDLVDAQPMCPNGVYGMPYQTVKQGDHGDDVTRVQRLLGITDDGCFGPGTETAVRDYQAAVGLYVEGQVGPCTWFALQNGYVKNGCKAASAPVVTAPADQPRSSSQSRIIVDQWREVVQLVVDGRVVDTMPMIDNHTKLAKGQYTVCEFKRTNYDHSLAWKLPNFVRLCTSSGERTGKGFHAIPVSTRTGRVMHDDSYLGTGRLRSSGCIRLSSGDSQLLWDFATQGMAVVVQ